MLKCPQGVPQEVCPLILKLWGTLLGAHFVGCFRGRFGELIVGEICLQKLRGTLHGGTSRGTSWGVSWGASKITGHASQNYFTGHFTEITGHFTGRFAGRFMAQGRFMARSKIVPKTAFRLAPKNCTLKFCLKGGPGPPFWAPVAKSGILFVVWIPTRISIFTRRGSD